MTQPRKQSVVEVLFNTAVGWGLSVVIGQAVIYPMFDIELSLVDNMGATALFTLVSMAKHYAIRRGADWYQHRRIK